MTSPVKTTFANGINPFTGLPVNAKEITISEHIAANRGGKDSSYYPIFDTMERGSVIICKSEETHFIRSAIGSWLRRNKLSGTATSKKNYVGATDPELTGRVWWL